VSEKREEQKKKKKKKHFLCKRKRRSFLWRGGLFFRAGFFISPWERAEASRHGGLPSGLARERRARGAPARGDGGDDDVDDASSIFASAASVAAAATRAAIMGWRRRQEEQSLAPAPRLGRERAAGLGARTRRRWRRPASTN
jgi:hypothetical protein